MVSTNYTHVCWLSNVLNHITLINFQGYGRAKHATVCDLLKKKYPHYTNIDWSDDGY